MYEMKKKYEKDYTIKEIYENFSFFEEEYNSIIDVQELRSLYGNEFYSKLKFAKALHEYRKTLYWIPYIEKYRDGMIDKILDSVKSVKTMNIEKDLQYDSKSGAFIFSRYSTETLVFEDLMKKFTEIALKDIHTIGKDINGNEMEYSSLDKARIDYIGSRVNNIRENIQYRQYLNNGYQVLREPETFHGKVYQRLVNIFGEKKMLSLTSNNIDEFSKEFGKYGIFEIINENFNKLDDANLSNKDREEALNDLNSDLNFMEMKHKLIVENNREPSKKSMGLIKGFKKILDLDKDILSKLKEQLYNNLLHNAKDFEYIDFESNEWAGVFDNRKFKISLNKASNSNVYSKYKTILHELMHAATTEKDYLGRTKKIGFQEFGNFGKVVLRRKSFK